MLFKIPNTALWRICLDQLLPTAVVHFLLPRKWNKILRSGGEGLCPLRTIVVQGAETAAAAACREPFNQSLLDGRARAAANSHK